MRPDSISNTYNDSLTSDQIKAAFTEADMAYVVDLMNNREANVAAARIQAHTPIVNSKDTVGRNDPCPCGSGKKYKKCCLTHSNTN